MNKPRAPKRILFSAGILLAVILGGWTGHHSFANADFPALPNQTAGVYPYGSSAFNTFIADSYSTNPRQGLQAFYDWLTAAYAKAPAAVKLAGHSNLGLTQAIAERKRQLAALRGVAERTRLELDTATWLHRMVKSTIPKFSLDRGFEFSNTVLMGERQCLLQSVLIAGLLQEMGLNAGSTMVWKNGEGKVSNLGHVSAILRLSDGRDVLVDASEPTPFFKHQGLFMAVNGQMRFLEPQYAPDSSSRAEGVSTHLESTISAYTVLADNSTVQPKAVAPLSNAYLRSQFFYYRGERAAGGFLDSKKTPEGLEASRRFLKRAIEVEPANPLATYVLGMVYHRLGKANEAKEFIGRGYQLYGRFGFVPNGPKAAMENLNQ